MPIPASAIFLCLPQLYSAGVEKIVPTRFKMKKSDDFTMFCQFSSGASAFTWGENFTAQVVPSEGGATVKVQGVGKVGAQVMQSARTNKLVNQFFDDLVAHLRNERA